MKTYRYTIDNYFRHPFRWGKCPMNIGRQKIYGIYFHYGEMLPTRFKKRWVFIIYFYKWCGIWSNYPITTN